MKAALMVLWKIFGGTKLIFAAIELAVGWLKAKYPDVPIPEAEFWQGLAVAMYSVHSGRDLWEVMKTLPKALAEYYAKAKPPQA